MYDAIREAVSVMHTHRSIRADTPEILTQICSFAESVGQVAWAWARLINHPWTIVWAHQETLPCAVELDESSLKGWLSGVDIYGNEGTLYAFNAVLETICDLRTGPPHDPNYAHAEGALIRSLLDSGAPGDLFLGTSDDTCYPCCEYLTAVNSIHGTSFKVRACSGCVHPTAFPEMDEDVAQALRKSLLDTLVTHFAEDARIFTLCGTPRSYEHMIKTNPEFARFIEEEKRRAGE
ncbi:hypothetical protein OH76DRAFT_1247090 [Lentinus brumalis]|uniref:Uncharacterized protein n=1 Tax=Lentinus brumalis TaxID=2498619 RepID=A0A371CRV4_9APHY|nr:hypothetical protein OH76DRAFT_1247090 [Polyporus brumalis]